MNNTNTIGLNLKGEMLKKGFLQEIKHMDIYVSKTKLCVHASLPLNKMYQKHYVLDSKLTEQIKERSF